MLNQRPNRRFVNSSCQEICNKTRMEPNLNAIIGHNTGIHLVHESRRATIIIKRLLCKYTASLSSNILEFLYSKLPINNIMYHKSG